MIKTVSAARKIRYDYNNEYHHFLVHQMTDKELDELKDHQDDEGDKMRYLNNIKLNNYSKYFSEDTHYEHE